MKNASLAKLLFGDFPASIESPYPPTEAAARLSQATRGGAINGYATMHEVVVSGGIAWLANPFQPTFKGSFVAANSASRLEGRFVANGIIKVWLGLGLPISAASIVVALARPSPSLPLVEALGAFCIVLATGALLRVAMHPRSPYVQALTMALHRAIAGEVPNNSSKPTRPRGAA